MSQLNEDLIFYIEHDKPSDCEFEYHFNKSLNFNENYSCALLECNLPKNLKVDRFQHRRKLFLNCIWIKNFVHSAFYESPDLKRYHKQTNFNFKDSIFEFEFGPDIYSGEDFLKEYRKIDIELKIKEFYDSRFKDAYSSLIKNVSLKLPEIVFENNKFKTSIGETKYHGLFTEEDIDGRRPVSGPGLHGKPDDEVSKIYFDKDSSLFYKYRTAWIFFTFDEVLHEILGFNKQDYPIVEINETVVSEELAKKQVISLDNPIQYDAVLKNNGLATFKPQFRFDMIYLHSNIVKESYILNKKASILRVFPKKSESQGDIIHYKFEYPVFIPLRFHEIDVISFKITNEFTEIATFEEGLISLKVVFKLLND